MFTFSLRVFISDIECLPFLWGFVLWNRMFTFSLRVCSLRALSASSSLSKLTTTGASTRPICPRIRDTWISSFWNLYFSSPNFQSPFPPFAIDILPNRFNIIGEMLLLIFFSTALIFPSSAQNFISFPTWHFPPHGRGDRELYTPLIIKYYC